MKRGDVRKAVEAARRLGTADGGLEEVRGAFLALLDQRGYFVGTSEQIDASLREIQDVGPGFDLYDLAEALAARDVHSSQLAPFRRR
ncbi:MAG TPA: hypothetical protein VF950_29060 [Planctomycetota bacterium]